MEMGLFNNYKIDLDKETQKAQQEAFVGYVIIDILDEEGPEWKRNEINARDIDQNQAMLLIGHFLETKCEPMRNWLVASIEEEDAFETLDESPLEFATSPYSATKVKVVGNVWRVAGNHRMWGIRKYFKACRVGASQSSSLTEAMDEVGEGNVLLMGNRNTTAEAKATFEKILELIQNEWRYWPVAVYWRKKLMANTKPMAALRSRLAGNKTPHQYEGTPREVFQMIIHDPAVAGRYLNQETARIWYARALRDLIALWIPFTSLEKYPTFTINANASRIDKPWLGTWTTLVCQTLRILQDLVTPTQEEIQSQESSDATIDSFYSFVTVKLLEVFDTAYVSTLGQVIRKDFPLTNDGFVTTEWREAYDEYCALIIQGAPHVIQDVEQLPVGLPTPWYELRTTFSSMVVKRIRLAAAAATASPPNATRIQTTLPWFSESVADDFLLLAQQVGPAMSIMAEILEPAWRNCKPAAAKPGMKPQELAATRNRKDSDFPDDSSVVIYQATLRMNQENVPEHDILASVFNFISYIALSPVGTSLSAKVLDLSLRRADGIEDPTLGFPLVKLTPLAKPRRKPPTPRSASWVKASVVHVLSNEIVRLAMVRNRPHYQEGDRKRYLEPGEDLDQAKSWIDNQFLKYFEHVKINSFFRHIAPQLTVDFASHVHHLYSLWHWMTNVRVKALQIFVDSTEFAFFWARWCTICTPETEKFLYHAFVVLPTADRPEWNKPRLHSFVLAFEQQLPTVNKDDAWKEERALAHTRARAMLKVSKKAKITLGIDNDSESEAKSAKSSGKKGSGKKGTKASTPEPSVEAPYTDIYANAFGEYLDQAVDDDSASRSIGAVMCSITVHAKAGALNVMHAHSLINLAIASFVAVDLPPSLFDLCATIRWSVLAAIIAYGRADKTMYIPPPPKALVDGWKQAINDFEKAANTGGSEQVSKDDLLNYLSIPKQRSVGELPLTPDLLWNLRRHTDAVLKEKGDPSFTSSIELATSILHRLEKASLASRAPSTTANPPAAPAPAAPAPAAPAPAAPAPAAPAPDVEQQSVNFDDHLTEPPTAPSSPRPPPSSSNPEPPSTGSSANVVPAGPPILTRYPVASIEQTDPSQESQDPVPDELPSPHRRTRSGQVPPSPTKPPRTNTRAKTAKGGRGGKGKAPEPVEPEEEQSDSEGEGEAATSSAAGPSAPAAASAPSSSRKAGLSKDQMRSFFGQ